MQRLLQLSERQVQRLQRRYRAGSVGWARHGSRGRSVREMITREKLARALAARLQVRWGAGSRRGLDLVSVDPGSRVPLS